MKGDSQRRRRRLQLYVNWRNDEQVDKLLEWLDKNDINVSDFFIEGAIKNFLETTTKTKKQDTITDIPRVDEYYQKMINGMPLSAAYHQGKINFNQLGDIYKTNVKLLEEFQNLPSSWRMKLVIYERHAVRGYKPQHYS